jgi:peptide/nickel transport system permease protein
MKSMSLNAWLGLCIIGAVLLMALLAAVWTPYDPDALDYLAMMQPPSAAHLLGTDDFGRDILSRLMVAGRTSVLIAIATVSFAAVAGTIIGTISGYFRGTLDGIIMMLNSALLSFPGILLALGLVAIFGASASGTVVALGIAFVPAVVRVVRGNVLSLRELDYIAASRVMGNSSLYTMLRHLIPNSVAPIAVLATSMFGWALLSESALSFLGLGVQPPAPTWGNMLAQARPYLSQAVWMAIFPGLLISISLLGINLLGDALRDRLDPRMKGIR